MAKKTKVSSSEKIVRAVKVEKEPQAQKKKGSKTPPFDLNISVKTLFQKASNKYLSAFEVI